MVPSKDTDTLEPVRQGNKWHHEEAGTTGCSGRPSGLPEQRVLPTVGGPSTPLSHSCAVWPPYLSPLNFFIWRSGPALTWDFVLQTECSYVCEVHSRLHECCHSRLRSKPLNSARAPRLLLSGSGFLIPCFLLSLLLFALLSVAGSPTFHGLGPRTGVQQYHCQE